MAEQTHPLDDGKPSKNAPPPVIRQLVVAEEDGRTRLLKRQVPAWIISGLFHVVIILAFLLIQNLSKEDPKLAANDPPPNTIIEKPEDPQEDLTNEDLGLEPEFPASVEVNREDKVIVAAPVVDGEPPGLPDQTPDNASTVTMPQGDLLRELGAPGSLPTSNLGPALKGVESPGNSISAPGLEGRTGETRQKLIRIYGGNKDTERAVALALAWLAKQQKSDGHWEFDGSRDNDPQDIAATGMGLLPFLAAGETHKSGTKYSAVVAKAANWLKQKVGPDGHIGKAGHYANAIACIALCELAGMSQDAQIKAKAQLAVNFIVDHQAENGSWGYSGKGPGDTSIVGWQIQALKSARLANLIVPDKSFKNAEKFLDSVSQDSGSKYGYRTPGSSERLTAVGLLCRQYMGWGRAQPGLAKGVEWMWKSHKPTINDMYYTYYATQVFHFYDGPQWHRDWNPAMQAALLPTQITEKTPGAKPADIGSWNPDKGSIGSVCGRLGTTVLCTLSLEVYYRHTPLFKREAGGDVQKILEGPATKKDPE